MIIRKSKGHFIKRTWPYTPEPSPPLKSTATKIAVEEEFDMSDARPISIKSKRDAGILSPGWRPTLDDVLASKAPDPYTLKSYTSYLRTQHCSENLEFVTEAKDYAKKYDEAMMHYCGMPMTTDTDEGFELQQDWIRMMDIYVKPGAPREINLPAEERDDLIDEPYEQKPPTPEALDPAVRRIRDLMADSIFIPWCNSLRALQPQTFSTLPVLARGDLANVANMSMDDRLGSQRKQNPSRRTPPPTSAYQPSRSPPQNQTRASALSSALGRSGSGSTRLSHHFSHTSAESESSSTDQNTAESPTAGEFENNATPPLTPPKTDLLQSPQSSRPSYASSSHARSSRSDSTGWKKMSQRLFGGKDKK